MSTLRDRIKQARKASGLTQDELAKRAGVSRIAVVQWENGETKSLRGNSLTRAAAALEVEPLWLGEEVGPKHRHSISDDPYRVPRELAPEWNRLDKEVQKQLLDLIRTLSNRAPTSANR